MNDSSGIQQRSIMSLDRLRSIMEQDQAFFKSVLPVFSPQLDLYGQDQDTSLALPREERLLVHSHSTVNSDDPTSTSTSTSSWLQRQSSTDERSLRVQRQVQIILARRKKAASNGSIHLQRSITFQGPDPRNGASLNMKTQMNGTGYSQRSLSSGHLRRPSRRVEVSPSPSPELPPRSAAPAGTTSTSTPLRLGTYTLPGPAQPRRTTATMGAMLERSYYYNNPRHHHHHHRRYAFSEVPRGSRLAAASTCDANNTTSTPFAAAHGGHRVSARHANHYNHAFNHTLGSHQVFSDSLLHQSGGGSPLPHDGSSPPPPPGAARHRAVAVVRRASTSVARRRQAAAYGTSQGGGGRDNALTWLSHMRRQGGDGTPGQPDDALDWLAHMRMEGEGEGEGADDDQHQDGGPRWARNGSGSPSSVVSMEVDLSRRMEIEDQDVPLQHIHIQDAVPLRSEVKPAPAVELTLERAVNLLTQQEDEDALVSAAEFIQKQCFNSTDAKRMVFYLHGIPKLLSVLQGDSEEGQRAAAGALRNLVFQSSENKMEVKDNGGVATILMALKSNRELDTRRQLTGVLWNLSSHDLLKEHLSREALCVLTSAVLVPCSGISEGENPKDDLLADPEVFHNATGCLRNVSSAGPDGRKAMRECDNLIDSLVYYIRRTIADYKPDDKSIENCVCILHNLSYQIEAELPQKYLSDLGQSRQSLAPTARNAGCFSQRSAKITQKVERQRPLLEERSNPCGVEWLWSPITIRMYLSLMACSGRHCTQEAAVGALQNITAGNGRVTEAIAHSIVQRENGLHQVKRMLQHGESDVRRMCVSLLKNLSRYRELHADIVKQVLPELVAMLPNWDVGAELPTEVTVSLCHILTNLSQNDTANVKAIVNHAALPRVISISTKDSGYGPTRAGQAACVLLHSMWSHTELHGAYRKAGYRKSDFINARSTKAVNSSRD